jgi:hypothetical protein
MAVSVKQLVLGYIVCYMQPIYLMYIVAFLMRWQYYHIIEDREIMNSALKKLKQEVVSTALYSVQNRTVLGGYFFSKRCIGFVEITYETPKISVFCAPSFYEMLKDIPECIVETTINSAVPTESPPRKNPIVKIDVFVRKGTYKNFYYNKLKLDLTHVLPVGDQTSIVKQISTLYEKMGRATVFIDGVTNAGKSTLGFLLAKELQGAYCHTFNPTEAGDHLTTLTMEHMFDEGPLILVMEEVDETVKRLHKGDITLNREIPTLVYNKSTWSSFLDDMLFYKKVVLIMTSNTSKAELDALDPSYLRLGRVHAAYSMPSVLQSNALFS